MAYYDTVRSFNRRELGTDLVCHVKRGGYTEIVALGPFTDRASVYDNDAFGDGPTGRREFRNALRRHVRAVKRIAAKSESSARLEYLRDEIRAERISYGEIAELQSLVKHIRPDDLELLEWAGEPENN